MTSRNRDGARATDQRGCSNGAAYRKCQRPNQPVHGRRIVASTIPIGKGWREQRPKLAPMPSRARVQSVAGPAASATPAASIPIRAPPPAALERRRAKKSSVTPIQRVFLLPSVFGPTTLVDGRDFHQHRGSHGDGRASVTPQSGASRQLLNPPGGPPDAAISEDSKCLAC